MKNIIFLIIALSFKLAHAESLDGIERALDLISKSAGDICKNAPMSGSTNNLEISVGARAEVSKLIKKLVDIGVSGATKYQNNEYYGILQKDLAGSINDSNNCRLKVFNSLKDLLLSQAIPSTTFSKSNSDGAMSEGVYGNTKCTTKVDANGAYASCTKGSQ
jgi:hypothetical protein